MTNTAAPTARRAIAAMRRANLTDRIAGKDARDGVIRVLLYPAEWEDAAEAMRAAFPRHAVVGSPDHGGSVEITIEPS